MTRKKPLKIEYAPGFLEDLERMMPDAKDREEFLEQIKQEFASDELPGHPVLKIAPGTEKCPLCGGKLDEPSRIALRGDSLLYQCLDCERCFSHDVQ